MGDFNRSGGGRGGKFGGRRDGGSRGFGGGGGGRGFGNRSFGGGSRDRDDRRPEMHDAVCDQCGKDCQVPFRPTMGKPIFCSDCFEKKEKGQDFGGGRERFGDDRGGDRFNRREERFDDRGDRDSNRFEKPKGHNNADFSVQFAAVNAKLDKILKLLEPKPIRIETAQPAPAKAVKPAKAEVNEAGPAVTIVKATKKTVKKKVTKKVA